MTNLNQYHKVIILDDDDRYVKPQLDLAYTKFNIELVHFTNWEEAKSSLENSYDDYEAIIVDGKGQLSKDEKVEDDAHLNVVIGWLKEQKGKGKYIPIFINTGFHEEISKYWKTDDAVLGVFKKGENQTLQLFEEVVHIITNAKHLKYEIKYKAAFNVFDNVILPKDKKSILINCIVKIENGGLERKDFNSIRELLELVYKKLNTVSMLPDEFFTGNKVSMEWCYRYLCGLPVDGPERKEPIWKKHLVDKSLIAPKHIQYCLQFVKDSSSAFSHDYPHPFTASSFAAVTFSMMEILNWFHNCMITCNNKTIANKNTS